jgi:hypothetical protein
MPSLHSLPLVPFMGMITPLTVISVCRMFVAFGVNYVYTCCSVESSEYLSDLLKSRNIPHNVLNARPKVCKPLLQFNLFFHVYS